MMTDAKKQISTNPEQHFGYAARLMRVDLTGGKITDEPTDEAFRREYIGGAAMGIKYVYDEVPPGVAWSAPENRLFFGSGPLGGTRIHGSGAVAVVTKGALTEGMASSQANGFFGAFIRFAGYDGILIQGASPSWVYLHIQDGKAELKDASHLLGKDNFETDRLLKEQLKKKEREVSILSIGPAGENMVRFACVVTDLGHVASHNGVGAVMGSKKLKAIVIDRAKNAIPLKDSQAVSRLAKDILDHTLDDKFLAMINREGTIGGVYDSTPRNVVPVKNYTTNVHVIDPDKLEAYKFDKVRGKFNAKPAPCWACSSTHCHMMEITDGKYAGRVVEEPEYECMAAFSSLVGVNDVTTTVLLASEVDRLGLDTNEAGWVISLVMDCYEKGILTSKDTDGLEMTWGNGEAIMAMLKKIATREGFGAVLAEGVMRAARRIGGPATDMAVHTQKGNTPRGHDHRIMWFEMFDTCVSNTGTLETRTRAPLKLLGLPETYDPFDPMAISTMVAKTKGAMVFEDSLVTCHFQTACALVLLCEAVNAATGWDMDFSEAMAVGRRAVNLARLFNMRNGISPELDRPSARYGSIPPDGPAAGRGIGPHWDNMLQNYYELMGWDKQGKPLAGTLKSLGID